MYALTFKATELAEGGKSIRRREIVTSKKKQGSLAGFLTERSQHEKKQWPRQNNTKPPGAKGCQEERASPGKN